MIEGLTGRTIRDRSWKNLLLHSTSSVSGHCRERFCLVKWARQERNTHLESHHKGWKSVKRLLHLVSSKVRMEIYSISSDSLSFLTGKIAGLGAKWISGDELEW